MTGGFHNFNTASVLTPVPGLGQRRKNTAVSYHFRLANRQELPPVAALQFLGHSLPQQSAQAIADCLLLLKLSSGACCGRAGQPGAQSTPGNAALGGQGGVPGS